MSYSEKAWELALTLIHELHQSPFPHRIIRLRLKDGTFIEVRKINHELQKVYWSKLDDPWT